MTAHEDAVRVAKDALDEAWAARDSIDLSWIQPPPMRNGWTLAPDALKMVGAIVQTLQPAHVLELGAGLSTRMIVRSCKEAGLETRVSSIDHDPEYGVLSESRVREIAPDNNVTCQFAPVVARDFGAKLLPAYLYDPKKLASDLPPDLVLLDGPPVTLGGREGVLYQVMELARPGTLVLLDDAARRSERQAVANWKSSLGDAIEVINLEGFAKGMAAVIVREPVRIGDLWERKLALTKMEIERAAPVGCAIVLVDQNYWGEPLGEGRSDVALVEREGVSWGPPANETQAIEELESRREEGAGYIAFLWPAFWWKDCYPALFDHLFARFECSVENDRLLLFKLTPRKSE